MERAASTVRFNVGGVVFEVARSTVDAVPDAFLSRLIKHTPIGNDALFIDRDPALFSVVLNYYRNREVDVPPSLSWTAVRRELDFFCLNVESTRVHVQNVGAHWRGRTGSAWSERVAAFFSAMFETPWFERRMAASLELTVVMGPPRPHRDASETDDVLATDACDACVLFGTKTARRLATNVLSQRFNLMSRWEAVDAAKSCVSIEYPLPYTYYPPSGCKLHQLVLLCQVGEAGECGNKRSKRRVGSVDA